MHGNLSTIITDMKVRPAFLCKLELATAISGGFYFNEMHMLYLYSAGIQRLEELCAQKFHLQVPAPSSRTKVIHQASIILS